MSPVQLLDRPAPAARREAAPVCPVPGGRPEAPGDGRPSGPAGGRPYRARRRVHRTGTPARATPGGRRGLVPVAERSGRRGPTPVRLTDRGRALLVTVLLLAGLAGGSLVTERWAAADAPAGQVPRAGGAVIVQPGDTLWEIAVRVAPQRDPRDTVARLVAANGLSGVQVRAGQQLVVPVPW